MSNLNIFQRMSAITAQLQTVAKNLTVQATKTSSYKAVSERDIIDAVKPIEIEHGVYSYPCDREILESQTLESESTYNNTITKKTIFMTRMKTVYRFKNIDNPDDYIDMVVFSEGIDSQDKGSGKAMTYADKYALMKAYKISTGDDPDEKASEEVKYTPVKKNVQTKQVEEKPLSPRRRLFALLEEHGIDSKQYAAEKSINKETPESVILECIKELEILS